MGRGSEGDPESGDSSGLERVHPTVMPKEVIAYLGAVSGGHLWVDATLGTAGHSVALCEAIELRKDLIPTDNFKKLSIAQLCSKLVEHGLPRTLPAAEVA